MFAFAGRGREGKSFNHRWKQMHTDEEEMRFKDRVCLVTGSGSGIGRATCMRMSKEGGHAVVVDLKPDHGNETVALIEKAGGSAIFVKAHVGNPAEIRAAVEAA